MKNAYEQTKHSILANKCLVYVVSRDTVLSKHKLRSQTQVCDIHQFLTMTI